MPQIELRYRFLAAHPIPCPGGTTTPCRVISERRSVRILPWSSPHLRAGGGGEAGSVSVTRSTPVLSDVLAVEPPVGRALVLVLTLLALLATWHLRPSRKVDILAFDSSNQIRNARERHGVVPQRRASDKEPS